MPLLAHPHVQRSVGVIGKPPLRRIQLMGGNADIQQNTVRSARPKVFFRSTLAISVKLARITRRGQALQTPGGLHHRVRVLVQG